MKFQNDRRGGHLLDNAFLAVHPYTIEWYNSKDPSNSQGVELDEWMRADARRILGVNINTLASEGGNPGGDHINQLELAFMQKYPNATQAFWIVSRDYLRGADQSSGDQWEKDSLIHVKDGEMIANPFFVNLWRVAHGQPMQ